MGRIRVLSFRLDEEDYAIVQEALTLARFRLEVMGGGSMAYMKTDSDRTADALARICGEWTEHMIDVEKQRGGSRLVASGQCTLGGEPEPFHPPASDDAYLHEHQAHQPLQRIRAAPPDAGV